MGDKAISSQGYPQVSAEGAAKFIPGLTEHEVLDVSDGDATPGTIKNSRVVSVDVAGIVKIQYGDNQVEVKYMAAGVWYHYLNVSKAYRYYVGTTETTATILTDAGASVIGIKLYR
jgi:hypothetical protein